MQRKCSANDRFTLFRAYSGNHCRTEDDHRDADGRINPTWDRRVPSKTDGRVIMARLTTTGKETLARSRALLVPWVEKNLRRHLDDKQLLALKDALEALLSGHGRWEGQMAHLAGGADTTKS
jgi:hypothetical protein